MIICKSSNRTLILILVPGSGVLLCHIPKNVEVSLELGNKQKMEGF